ncbi:MAG: hypothetical protein ACHP7C_00670 [Lysobacterales bacterium]
MSGVEQAALERALQLGAQMLGAAREQDWTAVAELRPEYDAALQLGASATETTREFMLELQCRHQQLVELAAQARDRAGRELEQQQRNHRALSAYLLPG